MSFQTLHVCTPIVDALREKGYNQPTLIQEQAIPAILTGRDVLASAQTGTGKTASFAIPVLQRLSETKSTAGGVRGLILTPTRELAIQVGENLAFYGKNLRTTSVVLYGGVSQLHQVRQIRRGVDVIIATPGRLLDLINQRVVALSALEILVLDEADRMLDMGFIQDVRKLLALIPQKCQRIFLSATVPPEIQSLATGMLRTPITINIEERRAAVIRQGVYHVAREDKRALLQHVITEEDMQNVIVFARTKHGADKIVRELTRAGISAEAFHGDRSQGARQRALTNFRKSTTRVLVATDIAARGIDINHLPFVINYEMPDTIETYTHRIGRTGRAGNPGTALSFCDDEERSRLRNLNRVSPGKIEVLVHPFA